MVLSTYNDFMALGNNSLKEYLSVRGLSITGNKPELVARAFVAAEMKMNIILSSEEQAMKLKQEYNQLLSDNKLIDPREVPDGEKSNDIIKWVDMNSGKIFEYILRIKDFNHDYIGRYKDEKAYSYFDGGLVGEVLTYQCPNKDIQYVYCTVRASMSVNTLNDIWLAVKLDGEVITAWCSCMAGSGQCCNHIIAVLFKLEYATLHDLRDPACTSVSCVWNQSTKQDVHPKRISDINIRKKTRSTVGDRMIDDENPEATRMREIKIFDPRRFDERTLTDIEISECIMKIQEINPNAVVIKSIEECGIPKTRNFFVLEVAERFIEKDDSSSHAEKVAAFISALTLSEKDIEHIEQKTRLQGSDDAWKQLRRGRLTASMHHEIFTKVNTILRSRKKTVRYSTLIDNIVNKSTDISMIPSVSWGVDHENDAFNSFNAKEILNHIAFKLKKCGLFVSKQKPYIAASPDAILQCKCHKVSPVEIKCPWKIRDLTVKEGATSCDFLNLDDGKVSLNLSHKYATQLNSQMAMIGANQGYFVVWTTKETFIQMIPFRKDSWDNLSTNLEIFFKRYVSQAILRIRPLSYCEKCGLVLLEDEEIEKRETVKMRIYCSSCSRPFHKGCVAIADINDWLCDDCILSLL